MNKLNQSAKIFLYICFSSGVLWIGTYLARLLLAYQLFEGKDLKLKQYINGENLHGILITINVVISASAILYPIFIVSFIVFLLFSRINLKENGWLFITMLIVFITTPFELYLLTIDYSLIFNILSGNFSDQEIIKNIIKRLNMFGSFSLVLLLSYLAAIYFVLFQPLSLKNK